MLWAWKDTILSHYSVLSGKGLRNGIHTHCDKRSVFTLSLFPPLCNFAEGPPLRNLGPLNERGLGLLSSDSNFVRRPPNIAYLVRIFGVRIIGAAHAVCQTNWQARGCSRPVISYMRSSRKINKLSGITVIAHRLEWIQDRRLVQGHPWQASLVAPPDKALLLLAGRQH